MTTGFGDNQAHSSMRVLSTVESYELLAVATVGRIGFVSSAGIAILPVNYRLGANHRVFANTNRDGTLARLAQQNTPVAFQVDYHSRDFTRAWSVLMNGTLALLDPAANAAYHELRRPPISWPGLAAPTPIQFVLQTVSGRELFRH